MSKDKVVLNEGNFLFTAKQKERSKKVKERYLKNPSRCKYCNKIIPYEKRSNKFCNHSCAASFNNTGVPRGKLDYGDCIFCGKELKRRSKTNTCSMKCLTSYKWKEWVTVIERAKEFVGYTWKHKAERPKKYLIKTRGHKCEICGGTEWNGKPIPLVFDHINGDASNWRFSNCRLVCGNCDMQLPTYKSKNRGNCTRKYRSQMDTGA